MCSVAEDWQGPSIKHSAVLEAILSFFFFYLQFPETEQNKNKFCTPTRLRKKRQWNSAKREKRGGPPVLQAVTHYSTGHGRHHRLRTPSRQSRGVLLFRGSCKRIVPQKKNPQIIPDRQLCGDNKVGGRGKETPGCQGGRP